MGQGPVLPPQQQRELTELDLLNAASRLTVIQLAIQLSVDDHKVDTMFKNNRGDIEMTVYEMLKYWHKGQEDSKVALKNLTHALKAAGFGGLAATLLSMKV